MRIEPDITEVADLIAAWHGVLDGATIAWLDQQSATLAERVALSALIDAWHDDDQHSDIDPDELLLGRLVVAMAIVTKVRPVRIEAD